MKFILQNIDSISIGAIVASWLLFMMGIFFPAIILLGLVLFVSVGLLIQSSEL